MAIDKFGPNAFATGSVTSDALATGTIATADIADDAVTTAKVADTVNLGRRNLVINGDFRVWQRGTAHSGVSTAGYHADRFYFYPQNSSAVFQISQSTNTPNGFGNAYLVEVTTADTSIASNEEVKIIHKLEGQDLQRFKKGTSDAQGFMLSFYFQSTKTGTYVVELYDRDNGRDISKSINVTDTNWNRYTLNFPSDTTGSFDNDANSSLEISWWLVAGSAVQGGTLNESWRTATDPSSATGQVNFGDSTSNYCRLTGIQLEVGDTATPFEHRSYGEELTLCQRYYQQPAGAMWGTITNGGGSFSNLWFTQVLPVEMRADPTVSVLPKTIQLRCWGGTSGNTSYGDRNFDGSTITTINSAAYRKKNISGRFAIPSGITRGELMLDRTDDGNFSVDAEL